MSGTMNWGRLAQERKFFTPRAGAQPATLNQINYILDLAHQKGQPKPKVPKTKRGASHLIDRLLEMPDAPGSTQVSATRPVPVSNEARAELVQELRETFPVLTPMMVNSLVALTMAAVDELGACFFFGELTGQINDDTPADYAEELIPWILTAFLDWLE